MPDSGAIVAIGPRRRMAFKDGVRLSHVTPALAHLMNTALQTQQELGYPETLVVTSIIDGSHDPDGQHFKNGAIDLRTSGNRMGGMGALERKQAFHVRWQELAGARFTILLEHIGETMEHLHGQVKKGHEYP